MSEPRFTSTGNVIAKVYRDIKPSTSGWESDAVEWIGDALSAIGSYPLLETHNKILNVFDYRAELPNNFYRIKNVFFNPSFKHTVHSSDIPEHLMDRVVQSFIEGGFPLQKGTGDFVYDVQTKDIDNPRPPKQRECYWLRGYYILTSFQEGSICLSYSKFSTDEKNFPLIPDDYSVKEAILWYIIMKMTMRGDKLNNNKIQYDHAKQEWLRYCTQARGQLNELSEKEAEAFRNSWVRMVHDMDADLDGYASLSDKEYRIW